VRGDARQDERSQDERAGLRSTAGQLVAAGGAGSGLFAPTTGLVCLIPPPDSTNQRQPPIETKISSRPGETNDLSNHQRARW